jgi:hypothetical protein
MMFFIAESGIAPAQEAFNFWMLILTAVTVLAILAGPILAIRVDRWISKHESVRRRKNAIFETLMTTRATSTAFDHVRSLNMIDLAWYGRATKDGPRRTKTELAVLSAWKAYLAHLGAPLPQPATPQTDAVFETRRQSLLVDLLIAMATDLKYQFDREQIEKSVYAPRLHWLVENELALLRQAAIRVFAGENPLKISIAPLNEKAAAVGEEFISNLVRVLKAEQSIRIDIDNLDSSNTA